MDKTQSENSNSSLSGKKLRKLPTQTKFRCKREQQESVNRLHRGDSVKIRKSITPRFRTSRVRSKLKQFKKKIEESVSKPIDSPIVKPCHKKQVSEIILDNPFGDDMNKSMIVLDANALEASCEKSTDETIKLRDEIRALKFYIDSQDFNTYEVRYLRKRKELQQEVSKKQTVEVKLQEALITVEQKNTEIEDLKGIVQVLKNTNKKLRNQNSDLNKEAEGLEKKILLMDKMHNSHQDFPQKQLKGVSEALLSSKNTEIHTLKSQITTLQSQVLHLKSQIPESPITTTTFTQTVEFPPAPCSPEPLVLSQSESLLEGSPEERLHKRHQISSQISNSPKAKVLKATQNLEKNLESSQSKFGTRSTSVLALIAILRKAGLRLCCKTRRQPRDQKFP
ncbi:unnamed protein product [Moneuplotes crassus]|uniref:Uncharacterized protein n=1 Tax=Euplotes crassus TaxID=5936 RepID=A0AAD1UJH0_EUPCR|nr:unnamed protein product [Moneuplotes crassus]